MFTVINRLLCFTSRIMFFTPHTTATPYRDDPQPRLHRHTHGHAHHDNQRGYCRHYQRPCSPATPTAMPTATPTHMLTLALLHIAELTDDSRLQPVSALRSYHCTRPLTRTASRYVTVSHAAWELLHISSSHTYSISQGLRIILSCGLMTAHCTQHIAIVTARGCLRATALDGSLTHSGTRLAPSEGLEPLGSLEGPGAHRAGAPATLRRATRSRTAPYL
jgi:hypothetical protein